MNLDLKWTRPRPRKKPAYVFVDPFVDEEMKSSRQTLLNDAFCKSIGSVFGLLTAAGLVSGIAAIL